MLCARAGSKLGRDGMWRGQLNPKFRGSPGATQQAPLCVGREGAKRQEGGLPSVLAPP